jgi:DNA polymerase-3 subunit alpha
VKERQRLHDVLVCIRNSVTLDKSGDLRRPNAEFYLKTASEMTELFSDCPEAIANSLSIADHCDVELDFTSYRFPEFPVPVGETTDSYLARLCWDKAKERYGELSERVREQITYELDLIKKLGLSGYFLIVWDIMDYAKRNGIPAQGRGSAANSIIAYILGITKVDPIRHNLFVGRFLNEEMSSIPDIDIDVSTNHREQLIQYVYQKYGEEHVAMVCTYVTFQARTPSERSARCWGCRQDLLDRMAKAVSSYSARDIDEDLGKLEQFRSYVTSCPGSTSCRSVRKSPTFPDISPSMSAA